MAAEQLELVVSSFKSQAGAGLALAALIDARSDVLRGIKELARVRRGDDNQIHFDESNDMSGGQVAYGGGTVGLLIGIIGGPLGMVIGGATGALLGGLGGKLVDTGIPNERLREIGELLAPNTSALVALVDPNHAKPLLEALAQGGGTTLSQTLDAGVSAQLAEVQAAAASAPIVPPASGSSPDSPTPPLSSDSGSTNR